MARAAGRHRRRVSAAREPDQPLGKTAQCRSTPARRRGLPGPRAGEAAALHCRRRRRSLCSDCSRARPTIRRKPARSRCSSSNRRSARNGTTSGPTATRRITLTSKFSFTDRGTHRAARHDACSSIATSIRSLRHPRRTARISTIDAEVTLAGGMATIREGRRLDASRCRRRVHAGRLCAAVDADGADAVLGVARTAGVRCRFCRRGSAHIEPRGRDEVTVGGRTVDARPLQRQRRRLGTRDAVDRRDRPPGRARRAWTPSSITSRPSRPELEARVPQLVARAASTGWRPWPTPRPPTARRRAARSRLSARTILDMTGRQPIRERHRRRRRRPHHRRRPVEPRRGSAAGDGRAARRARPSCPASGTCTPTSSRSSGARFISPPA